MDKVMVTVFFEEPFWVGVTEKSFDGMLMANKFVFGAEPKEQDVWQFILEQYYKLPFSPPVEAGRSKVCRNPKRMQREVQRQLSDFGIGTKSQQALKLQQEQKKIQRRQLSKAQKEEDIQRRFDLKQLKRKEKHRGR